MAVTGTVPGAGSVSLGLGAGAAAGAEAGAVRMRTGRPAAVTGAAVWAGAVVDAVVVVSGTVGGGWAAITFSPACSTSASEFVAGMRARATPRTAATTAKSATRSALWRGTAIGFRTRNGRST